jgi:MFS family permease
LLTADCLLTVTVTLFVLGFAIGPLAFSPLSELYGRQPIFFASLGGYFAFTFPSAFAQNAASLVVGRALAGIFAAAPMTVIGGTIADIWDVPDRGLPMALFSGTVFIGRELPVPAPHIGYTY